MSANDFDDLDRLITTAYDYPGSGQDETLVMGYDRHFAESLQIQSPATSLVDSLSYNHRGQLTRLNRPGTVPDTSYFYYGAAPAHPATGFVDGSYRLQNAQTPGLSHLSYNYDGVGNIRRIYDAIYKDNQTFSYDQLNRLAAAEGRHIWYCATALISCYDHEYSYDGTGNITNIRRDEQDSLYEYETWHGSCDEPAQPMPHAVKQRTGCVKIRSLYLINSGSAAGRRLQHSKWYRGQKTCPEQGATQVEVAISGKSRIITFPAGTYIEFVTSQTGSSTIQTVGQLVVDYQVVGEVIYQLTYTPHIYNHSPYTPVYAVP